MGYRFAGFELDSKAFILRVRGRPVDVPRKAVETLAVLVARSGEVVSKPELMDALWPDGFVEESNLTQNIYLLRRALREHGIADPIETHPRRGYSFQAPLEAERAHVHSWKRWAQLAAIAAVWAILAGSNSSPLPTQLDRETAHVYALGRYFWNLRSVDGMQRSIPYFRQVIARAPDRAVGYAALADAYTELADFEQPCRECAMWRRRAEQAAARALAVEPASAEAHAASGMIARVFRSDDRVAQAEFQTALALDPQNAVAHQWYGNMLVARGDLDAGVHQLQLAAAGQPISTATYAWLARGYYYERRYADAEKYARLALSFEPTRVETTVLLGLVQESRGRFNDALSEFAAASRLGVAADSQVLRAGVYAAMGRRRTALAMLRRIAPRAAGDQYASRDMVLAYAIAGEKAEARTRLAHLRFANRLSRDLFALDPHVRSLFDI